MKVHISLNVSDIEKSVEFYGRMFGTKPLKLIKAEGRDVKVPGSDTEIEIPKSGYAKFDIADPPLNLALNERHVDAGGSLSHLGLQVDSSEKVHEFKRRWTEAGLVTADEMDVTCCYARQDKTWVRDPDGNEWEAFVVLEDVESMDEKESTCCDGDFVGISRSESKLQTDTAPAASDAKQGCC
ncbi:MAG: VOC family protein [Acidobacteriota bacterium]|nr:VOC family protein [Acidobacteriota bacterium]MDH3528212.1 VOC family protein [Acidobacteriota bacterium]